jgi:hypothetical protein
LKEEAQTNGLGFAYAIGTWDVGKSCVTAIVNELSRNLVRTQGRGQHDAHVERRRLMGFRASDSDGFTYSHGRFPFNRTGSSQSVKRQIRNDKRSVKAREDRRIMREAME